jgi:hypothetical protein
MRFDDVLVSIRNDSTRVFRRSTNRSLVIGVPLGTLKGEPCFWWVEGGQAGPWLPDGSDVFATDWELVPGTFHEFWETADRYSDDKEVFGVTEAGEAVAGEEVGGGEEGEGEAEWWGGESDEEDGEAVEEEEVQGSEEDRAG